MGMEFITRPGHAIVHMRPNLARPSCEMFLQERIRAACVCVVCTVSPDGHGSVFLVLLGKVCAGSGRTARLRLEPTALLLDTQLPGQCPRIVPCPRAPWGCPPGTLSLRWLLG